MDYLKLERKFVDFILELLGPNEELDKIREARFKFIQGIILTAFEKEFPDVQPHIFLFGSFPLKTYLQESDLDITIIFEDKIKKCFYLNNSFDFMNKYINFI
jgi:DNA polymerase sigma